MGLFVYTCPSVAKLYIDCLGLPLIEGIEQQITRSGVPIRYAASGFKKRGLEPRREQIGKGNQPASKLGSQVTRGGNTAHRTVTMQMIMMKGITPL